MEQNGPCIFARFLTEQSLCKKVISSDKDVALIYSTFSLGLFELTETMYESETSKHTIRDEHISIKSCGKPPDNVDLSSIAAPKNKCHRCMRPHGSWESDRELS